MSKILTLLFVIICFTNICGAQVPTIPEKFSNSYKIRKPEGSQVISLSDLAGTEWIDRHMGWHYRFSSTSYYRLIYTGDTISRVDEWPFYLSEVDFPYTHEPEEETAGYFDKTKVGINQSGSYLFVYNLLVETADAYLVSLLSADSLLLFDAPTYHYFQGAKAYETRGYTSRYSRMNSIANQVSLEVCRFVDKMQSAYNCPVSDYPNNRFMHLGGPNGGYNVWIPYMSGSFDQKKLEPASPSDIIVNPKGICLSTVFARSTLDALMQRAISLGMSKSSSFSAVSSKNDNAIQAMVSGLRSMTASMLFMSQSEANAYAAKLYDAYVSFLNGNATTDDLVTLCAGCTMPQFNKVK